MKEISDKSWLRHPWRIAGLAVALFFGVQLLLCLHVTFLGRVVPGFSGRVAAHVITDDGAPVLYSYLVQGHPYHGWRRGIQWGDQELSVVYSPFLPRYHLTSVKPRIRTARALWREIDFLFRIGILTLGTLVGLLLVLNAERLPTALPRGWSLLPGLGRDE